MSTYTFDPRVQFDPPKLDKMYQDCFGYKTDGTFVEVGAYDGKSYSHTWGLAEMGWRGVYVEPVPDLAAACIKNHLSHPNITTCCCAAGEDDSMTNLDIEADSICGSTMNLSICKKPQRLLVPMLTLDTILKFTKFKPGFDLLSIDVEFSELRVLDGFFLDYWLPKMIIIELCEFHGGPKQEWSAPLREHCANEFPKCGYRKIYSDAINGVFVRP